MLPTIELRDVSHQFVPGAPVLTGINLNVSANGQSIAILAPSGSGKTTLLALVGGLVTPSSGEVRRLGMAHLSSHSTGCAWIFQTTNALGRRSALDNVAIVAMAAGHDLHESLEAARHCLARVGLQSVCDRPARHLSGGELQRVAIARALISDLPFVLADEPTGQLDAGTTAMVVEALFETVRAGDRSMLLVTHDEQIASRCGVIMRLHNGRLVRS